MTMQKLLGAAFVAATVTACGSTYDRPISTSEPQYGRYVSYGTVESVELVDRNSSGALGTIAGGVVGGLLGHQLGGGRGQTAATIAGAAGGAYAGHEIEKRAQAGHDAYKVTVRLDNGSQQTYAEETDPNVRPGDRVRIENGVLSRY